MFVFQNIRISVDRVKIMCQKYACSCTFPESSQPTNICPCSKMTSGSWMHRFPALMVGVNLERCQQILTRCLCPPPPHPPPGRELQPSAPLGGRYEGISVVDHTHIVNPTPQSRWVMAAFCCPGAFHTPDDRTQLFQLLSAQIYRPIGEPVAGLCSALLSIKTGTNSTYSIHSLLSVFHFLDLAIFCPRHPKVSSRLLSPLCSHFSDPAFHSLWLSDRSNPDQFLQLIFPLRFGSPSALSRRVHAQSMGAFQNSFQSRYVWKQRAQVAARTKNGIFIMW